MFNLNFNLEEPEVLTKEFLSMLYDTYQQILDSEMMRRKIISIVVVASALEENHLAIIDSQFYDQFKRNVNTEQDKNENVSEDNEEIELFGLVNLALNWKKIYKIYPDLKKIHRYAVKSEKIDFKTKVDLITEVSKFIPSFEA